jgi:hypothetical protein
MRKGFFLFIFFLFTLAPCLSVARAESPFSCQAGPEFDTTASISPEQNCVTASPVKACEKIAVRLVFKPNCSDTLVYFFDNNQSIEINYKDDYGYSQPDYTIPQTLGSEWARTFYFKESPKKNFTIYGKIKPFVENCTGCIFAGGCDSLGTFRMGQICTGKGYMPAKNVGQECYQDNECYLHRCRNNKCVSSDYEEKKNTLELSNGRKAEIKIMPETASAKAVQKLGELGFNVTLKEVGKGGETKAVYHLEAEKETRLFGFIKKKAKIEVDVDAEGDGKILFVKKPWWSFMTSGI